MLVNRCSFRIPCLIVISLSLDEIRRSISVAIIVVGVWQGTVGVRTVVCRVGQWGAVLRVRQGFRRGWIGVQKRSSRRIGGDLTGKGHGEQAGDKELEKEGIRIY